MLLRLPDLFFDMFTGCNFRHNPAVKGVQCNLRGNDVGAHLSPVFTTAAAVSSQELSIARITISFSTLVTIPF